MYAAIELPQSLDIRLRAVEIDGERHGVFRLHAKRGISTLSSILGGFSVTQSGLKLPTTEELFFIGHRRAFEQNYHGVPSSAAAKYREGHDRVPFAQMQLNAARKDLAAQMLSYIAQRLPAWSDGMKQMERERLQEWLNSDLSYEKVYNGKYENHRQWPAEFGSLVAAAGHLLVADVRRADEVLYMRSVQPARFVSGGLPRQ